MKQIELLAPAGDMDSLVAAVRTGADAVYLGLGDFNARRNAVNFTAESFKEAAEYLRVRGVKAYVTLNTLVRDDEMHKAAELAQKAAIAGANGFIVQDLGLARLLKATLPDIPLHVSTQMAVNSPAALPFVKQMGFSRAVTARELSKEQLKNMCDAGKKCGVEIEAFVHGALCVALSGQCYLSAAIGGRSANRGMCAGACRLPFGVKNPEEYALSLKDLSLVQNIPQMIQMGVSSLKIEGRMKDAEYVAAATAVCRSVIDGEPQNEKLMSLLKDIFSRSGFTNRYFTGKGETMQGVRRREDAAVSQNAKGEIHALYRKENGRTELWGEFSAKRDMPATLTFTDGKNTATVQGDIPAPAKNLPLCDSFAAEKLCKTGDTPFVVKSLQCNIETGLSLSGGALGEMRRAAIQKISGLRSAAPKVRINPVPPLTPADNRVQNKKIFVRLENINQFSSQMEPDGIIIPAGSPLPEFGGEIWAELSRRLLPETELSARINRAKEQGIKKILCNNIASVELAAAAGLTPVFGHFMNMFNSYSLLTASQMGGGAIASVELTAVQALGLQKYLPLGIITYGKLPLMLIKTCPKDGSCGCQNSGCGITLTDRTGAVFPLLCKDGAREVLNSRPLWMADRKGDIAGFDFEVLYFTNETAGEAAQILKDYKAGRSASWEFTRGLYYRGVK